MMRNRRVLTALDLAALMLASLGAINWGLSGAADLNVVRRAFGRGSVLERITYIVVGLAGLDLAWLTARFISGGYQTPPAMPQAQPGEAMHQIGRQVGQIGEAARRSAEQARQTIERGYHAAGAGYQQGAQTSPYQPYPPSRP